MHHIVTGEVSSLTCHQLVYVHLEQMAERLQIENALLMLTNVRCWCKLRSFHRDCMTKISIFLSSMCNTFKLYWRKTASKYTSQWGRKCRLEKLLTWCHSAEGKGFHRRATLYRECNLYPSEAKLPLHDPSTLTLVKPFPQLRKILILSCSCSYVVSHFVAMKSRTSSSISPIVAVIHEY